jgi:hypothetical protein
LCLGNDVGEVAAVETTQSAGGEEGFTGPLRLHGSADTFELADESLPLVSGRNGILES